ncbi:MAG: rhomboid family intramembrane serine protease [Flavobacteriales bacterium]|jgi:membrane associated rhomboid family serine protease|nr:rhomboid family intramembrane serine protease [Flavobacteriales bacterium]MBT6815131.1 rhomboid family intramembrane serine protease [Flavobacteriales bacterium]MBT7620176.1 rhomboid family intramembrane serine protease [Flavobacteriales bacterium]
MLGQRFNHLPEVVKNLLIINGLFFLATWALENQGINLTNLFALHQFQSPDFMPHQLVTHMFMHSNSYWESSIFGILDRPITLPISTHLLFNMFTLWMFGKTLENMWGGKRFLTYYMITGFGAALIYMAYIQFQINSISSNIDSETYNMIINKGNQLLTNNQNFTDPIFGKLNLLINVPILGASGAIYGLLLAFGMLFPNSLIYLYFAIPVKAKYFVGGIGVLALISGVGNNPGDNVAHFAHLGGMIFGIILLKYWKKKGDIYF